MGPVGVALRLSVPSGGRRGLLSPILRHIKPNLGKEAGTRWTGTWSEKGVAAVLFSIIIRRYSFLGQIKPGARSLSDEANPGLPLANIIPQLFGWARFDLKFGAVGS